jgi:hypothetical protein
MIRGSKRRRRALFIAADGSRNATRRLYRKRRHSSCMLRLRSLCVVHSQSMCRQGRKSSFETSVTSLNLLMAIRQVVLALSYPIDLIHAIAPELLIFKAQITGYRRRAGSYSSPKLLRFMSFKRTRVIKSYHIVQMSRSPDAKMSFLRMASLPLSKYLPLAACPTHVRLLEIHVQ